MGTFLNAVKNLINSLTAKTSSTASTADMVQLHDANGNPNGKISLADLASVLGGFKYAGVLGSGDDMDNTSLYGLYTINKATAGVPQNCPVEANGVALCFAKSWGIQIYVTTGNTTSMYVRTHTSTVFYPWKAITLTEV